jgi:hypothetical protein
MLSAALVVLIAALELTAPLVIKVTAAIVDPGASFTQ